MILFNIKVYSMYKKGKKYTSGLLFFTNAFLHEFLAHCNHAVSNGAIRAGGQEIKIHVKAKGSGSMRSIWLRDILSGSVGM